MATCIEKAPASEDMVGRATTSVGGVGGEAAGDLERAAVERGRWRSSGSVLGADAGDGDHPAWMEMELGEIQVRSRTSGESRSPPKMTSGGGEQRGAEGVTGMDQRAGPSLATEKRSAISFFQSVAKVSKVAYLGLAMDCLQTTKQLKVGFLEPG